MIFLTRKTFENPTNLCNLNNIKRFIKNNVKSLIRTALMCKIICARSIHGIIVNVSE